FFLPLEAALSSELFFESSVEEELSSGMSCGGELQAIMREFDEMFPLEFPSAPLDPQANLNSSKTCSLRQERRIPMPLSLAAFDSSDDSD
ncbi:hypothetical protein M9458_019328, partial [Cirrhinus mrigala]